MENLPVNTLNLQELRYIQPLSREEIELRNKLGSGLKTLDKLPGLNFAEFGKSAFVIVPEDIQNTPVTGGMIMGGIVGYSVYLCPKDILEEGLFSVYRVPRCDYQLFCPQNGPAVDFCVVRNQVEKHIQGFDFAFQSYIKFFNGNDVTPWLDPVDFYWTYMNASGFLNALSEVILRIDEVPEFITQNLTFDRGRLVELIGHELGNQKAKHLINTMLNAGASVAKDKALFQSLIDREPRKALTTTEPKKELEEK